MNRIYLEGLVIHPHDGANVSYEYGRGATTLADPSGEFAGFPCYDTRLAESRSQASAPNSPEGIMHQIHQRRVAAAAANEEARIAAAKAGAKVEYPEDPTRDVDYRQIYMLGSLIIRHPDASADELATKVLERFVYPQQDAIARDVPVEMLDDIIGTAVAGQQLYDQLAAYTQ